MRNLTMRNLATMMVVLAAAACSHSDVKHAPHDAVGCLAACPGASVVETSQDGNMCRCWQHRIGIQYTFRFPDSDAKLEYARARWEHNSAVAKGCELQGLGWEPTPDGSDIVCVKPEAEPDPATKVLRWTVR